MRRCGLLTLCLLAAAIPGAQALAQTLGSAGFTAGYLESSGPDVSHEREASLEGVSLFGTLSSFGGSASLQLEWRGVGTPDYRLRGISYWPRWTLEASVVQRAYFVGGDARFAWDPWDGTLDSRVSSAVRTYRPVQGSPVGHFQAATLPGARALLPESSPGWAMRDCLVELRSRGGDRGIAFTLAGTDREGLVPRTLLTATGFAPGLSPLTEDLPLGNPLGVVEVPERFRERDLSVSLLGFCTVRTWRWEGQASYGRLRARRLVTDWLNPFPGPSISEPSVFWGSQGRLRVGGRGPHGYAAFEGSLSKGSGDAGERKYRTYRLKAGYSKPLKGKTRWFIEGRASDLKDDVRIGPQGPHPIYRGPYYELLGPIPAESHAHTHPMQEMEVRGGATGKAWEASAVWTHTRSPESYARRVDVLGFRFAFSPLRKLRIELGPSWTWAGSLNPDADSLDGLEQSRSFRPSDARNWQGLDFSAQYASGPLLVRYTLGATTSPPYVGLRRRERQELLASFSRDRGPWSLRATARISSSTLSMTASTYAYPSDPADPEDPTHRYPIGDEWRRRGASGLWKVERALSGTAAAGWIGRWEYQALSAHHRLDDPRSYHYCRTGFYYRKEAGRLGTLLSAGAESYHSSDPSFTAGGVPPGPYLWVGLTERPGTRGFVAASVSFRF